MKEGTARANVRQEMPLSRPVAGPPAPISKNRCEREAFKASPLCKYLDLSEDRDAWGRVKFAHPHVQSLFDGWNERAKLR